MSENLNKYTLSEVRWGRYQQNVYVEIEANSKQDALEKYERLDLEEYSSFDYDCEDGDEVEINQVKEK